MSGSVGHCDEGRDEIVRSSTISGSDGASGDDYNSIIFGPTINNNNIGAPNIVVGGRLGGGFGGPLLCPNGGGVMHHPSAPPPQQMAPQGAAPGEGGPRGAAAAIVAAAAAANAAPMMEVPRRQAVVDRLRKRIENYRKRQSECLPKHDRSFNGFCEQNLQDTMLLKQKFLETKAKRAAKKSEKKTEPASAAGGPTLPMAHLHNSVSVPKRPFRKHASKQVAAPLSSFSTLFSFLFSYFLLFMFYCYVYQFIEFF